MLDLADGRLEWEVDYLGRSLSDDNKQCLHEGLGAALGAKRAQGL